MNKKFFKKTLLTKKIKKINSVQIFHLKPRSQPQDYLIIALLHLYALDVKLPLKGALLRSIYRTEHHIAGIIGVIWVTVDDLFMLNDILN